MNLAPALYPVGTCFKILDPNTVGKTLDVILSYVFHNGDTYRYHLGLVLGPVGADVPPMYRHCLLSSNGEVQWVDYTTVDEAEVTMYKLPSDLSMVRFVLRSHQDERWYWDQQGGWTIAQHFAKKFTWDEVQDFIKPKSSYFQPIQGA